MTFDPGTPPDGRRDLPPPGTQLPPPGGQLSPPGPLLPPPGSQLSPAGAPPRQEPPAWHHLPPEQLARLHQPGIVPLRPLYLGDIFGGALQTMRRNPSATIGTALVVLALLLVPSYLVSLAVTRATGLAEEDLAVLVQLVNLLFSGLASIALAGMIVHVVGEAVLGDRVGLAQTWQAVRGRIPALIGALLLISAFFVLATAAFVAVVVGLVLAMERATDGTLIVLVILLVVLALAFLVAIAWASSRVSLATAAVVLEKAGPWRALRRSWRLTQGWQAWRVLGITVLAGLVTGLFAAMVQLPVTAVMLFALDGLSGGLSPVHPVVLLADHLVQVVVQAFSIPFSAGVTALLYLDLRIRREGLDVALVRAAQDRAALRQR